MGQGLYRMLGFGCLNPPHIDWDNNESFSGLYDVLATSYEAEPDYLMLPMAVDDGFLQADLNLPSLPRGLPTIEPRTAEYVPQCHWWPDVGKQGVWVSHRVRMTWQLVQEAFRSRGIEIPDGMPVFVCDWD